MTIKLATTNQCTGCGACREACPRHAIQMKYDDEGFLRPNIDSTLCVECGLCQRSCPVTAESGKEIFPLACYAAQCKDVNLLLKSSSGGIFSVFALEILREGGVVYGCAFDESFNAHHIRVSNEVDLVKLRGSKYIQSDMGGCYLQCKKDLDSGLSVLFSGTPCQIAGIKCFLGKNYGNLLTVEVICHGVPSPLVWQTYLKNEHSKNGFKIQNIDFRNKSYSDWENYYFVSSYANGEKKAEIHRDNIYMRVFLRNLCLRPSCYECRFKSAKSGADFTIGDFWKIKETKLDSSKGVSSVIINSQYGSLFWEKCLGDICYEKCDLLDIGKNNAAYYSSVMKPAKRSLFMKKYKKVDMDCLLKRCLHKSLISRAVKKISNWVGGINK